jgi:hypothetical protein
LRAGLNQEDIATLERLLHRLQSNVGSEVPEATAGSDA